MRYFIKEYINKINIPDVLLFAKANDINLTHKEANILLNYLKKDWENIIYNPSSTIDEINKTFDKDKSKKIINLYNMYKTKYKNYL